MQLLPWGSAGYWAAAAIWVWSPVGTTRCWRCPQGHTCQHGLPDCAVLSSGHAVGPWRDADCTGPPQLKNNKQDNIQDEKGNLNVTECHLSSLLKCEQKTDGWKTLQNITFKFHHMHVADLICALLHQATRPHNDGAQQSYWFSGQALLWLNSILRNNILCLLRAITPSKDIFFL